MDRAATLRALSQEMGSFSRQKMNSSKAFAAAWTLSSETMTTATLEAAFQTGTSSMHDDDRILIWLFLGKRTLAAHIHHRHTGPSSGMMVGVLLDTRLDHILFALMTLLTVHVTFLVGYDP
ncbi:hypothetical protein TNCV_535621 [Trichonephila clavipes]|nr:hypothetical protein TNCV_535621 [Trichonephila clavipes]